MTLNRSIHIYEVQRESLSLHQKETGKRCVEITWEWVFQRKTSSFCLFFYHFCMLLLFYFRFFPFNSSWIECADPVGENRWLLSHIFNHSSLFPGRKFRHSRARSDHHHRCVLSVGPHIPSKYHHLRIWQPPSSSILHFINVTLRDLDLYETSMTDDRPFHLPASVFCLFSRMCTW